MNLMTPDEACAYDVIVIGGRFLGRRRSRYCCGIQYTQDHWAQHPEERCHHLDEGNYGLDLPALLALAHLAFITSDLAFLKAGEVYVLGFT
jgi:hypothetical protein